MNKTRTKQIIIEEKTVRRKARVTRTFAA